MQTRSCCEEAAGHRSGVRHCVVPPYLLERLLEAGGAGAVGMEPGERPSIRPPYTPGSGEVPAPGGPPAPDPTQVGRTLELDRQIRELRHRGALPQRDISAPSGTLDRTIHDAQNTEELPGQVVRREQDPPVQDTAVNEVFEGMGSVHAFLEQVYQQSSLDGTGLDLLATVHYGVDYDNAFWDGTQMVFGDGDGEVFTGFTPSLTVIAHELMHGLMQFTADLDYQGQSGALNESFADVLAACVEQFVLGQTAEQASWLIGSEVFGPSVQARALRSLAEPGTAYDDPRLGTDPQPGHMDQYVDTQEDYGGVHINSGIPSRAFHLAAVALGGHSWERAGQVWFDVVTSEVLAPDADFQQFADATLAAAQQRFGEEVTAAVRTAWERVGVMTSPGASV